MFPTQKLTKRRKKALAFRERKQGKSKNSPLDIIDSSEDEINVSNLEDQVPVDATQGQQGYQVGKKALDGPKRHTGAKREEVVVAERKRKWKVGEEEEGTLGESGEPEPKRRKRPTGSSLVCVEEPVEHVEVREEGEGRNAKRRFILFLGNLKYTTTPEAIQAHFSACVPPPTVRLLTPKPLGKSTKLVIKSKGCAFLEFKHRGALQQGLKFHHSRLDGRQINVELTAGGGGKGLSRTKKLKERNKELEGQRRRLHDSVPSIQISGAQRFSATSGAEQTHTRKRTWTTGDVEEAGTHRGGKKHQKNSKGHETLAKDFRTGMNAIPIG